MTQEPRSSRLSSRGLQDQCLAFLTSGPPLLPYTYNSNYQFVVTRDAVLVHAEMIHDARIIYTDGRPHLPAQVTLWMGDSIGRWEGNTLMVDTTNFAPGSGYKAMPEATSGGTSTCCTSSSASA